MTAKCRNNLWSLVFLVVFCSCWSVANELVAENYLKTRRNLSAGAIHARSVGHRTWPRQHQCHQGSKSLWEGQLAAWHKGPKYCLCSSPRAELPSQPALLKLVPGIQHQDPGWVSAAKNQGEEWALAPCSARTLLLPLLFPPKNTAASKPASRKGISKGFCLLHPIQKHKCKAREQGFRDTAF